MWVSRQPDMHSVIGRQPAVSQQGTARLKPDSILLIWAAMAGDGQGSQTGSQDGRTEQSLQSFVQSLDPSQPGQGEG